MKIYTPFAGILLTVTLSLGTAQAQYGRWEPREVHHLIDRVHEDLNRAYNSWRVGPRERHRLDAAEAQLNHFARDWEHRRFDREDLDGAIGSIQRVADENHMPPELRNELYRDLGRLREMRAAYERHEIGYRW